MDGKYVARARVGGVSAFSFCFCHKAVDSPRMLRAGTAAFRRLLDEVGRVDAVGIEERAVKFAMRSIRKD